MGAGVVGAAVVGGSVVGAGVVGGSAKGAVHPAIFQKFTSTCCNLRDHFKAIVPVCFCACVDFYVLASARAKWIE